MSFKLLRVIFKLGKILAVTPDYKNRRLLARQKVYAYLMSGFITVALGVALMYRKPDYSQYDLMNLVIQLLLDGNLYILNIYTILTVSWKKPLWHKLINNLKIVKTDTVKEPSLLLPFVITNIIYWSYQIYMTYTFYKHILGVEIFKQFAIEYLQLYDQYLINCLFHFFVKMLLARYQTLRIKLEHQFWSLQKLDRRTQNYCFVGFQQITTEFCLLKETVDIVNNIFGWPLLLITAYATLQALIYLQGTIVIFNHLSHNMVIYVTVVILWHCVRSIK
mgnify:CR=1 FL=1